MILTKKIQIVPIGTDEGKKETWTKIYSWSNIAYKCANIVSSHLYLIHNMEQFHYLNGEKLALTTEEKDKEGVLHTSFRNSTYQVLSKKYKGEVPTAILTSINSDIVANYKSDKKDIFFGKKAIRNYKETYPIPFPAKFISKMRVDGEKKTNVLFRLNGSDFITYFGKDRSLNFEFFLDILSGKTALKSSKIQVKNKKIYLLISYEYVNETKKIKLDEKKSANVLLDSENIITINYRKKDYTFGSKESYINRRIVMFAKRVRIQKIQKDHKGGRGRKEKMKNCYSSHINHEKAYFNNLAHKYSHEVIKFCLDKKIGSLSLIKNKDVYFSHTIKSKDKSEKEIQYQRNWGEGNLLEKIKYKAKKFNIIIEEIKETKEKI